MNNSSCQPQRAPPLPAPHTLFVVVLFSSCESAQHSAARHPDGKINFGCLPLCARRDFALCSVLFISLPRHRDCLKKNKPKNPDPFLLFTLTKPLIKAKNGFAFNKSGTKVPGGSLKCTSRSSKRRRRSVRSPPE